MSHPGQFSSKSPLSSLASMVRDASTAEGRFLPACSGHTQAIERRGRIGVVVFAKWIGR